MLTVITLCGKQIVKQTKFFPEISILLLLLDSILLFTAIFLLLPLDFHPFTAKFCLTFYCYFFAHLAFTDAILGQFTDYC